MKLYNQNEVRGGRLIAHLQDNESSAEQTRDWIGTDGIRGLNPNARVAIVSGRDNAIAGARLMSALEQGEGRLSQAWRHEVHENSNPSLLMNFNAEIGRAHVCTPVTNAHLVCRLLLEKTNKSSHTTPDISTM